MVTDNELVKNITSPCTVQIGPYNSGERTDKRKKVDNAVQIMLVIGGENIHHKEIRDKTEVER